MKKEVELGICILFCKSIYEKSGRALAGERKTIDCNI